MVSAAHHVAEIDAPTGPTVGSSRRSTKLHQLEAIRHAVAVTLSAAALSATVAGWSPDPASALVIVIAAAAIGLPHGALDVVIGPSVAKPLAFFGAYIGFAAAIVLFWLWAPLSGFAVFFASSWVHFARGDADHHHQLGSAGGLLGISTAGCAIGLPLALHSETVAPLLSDLLLGTATMSARQVAALGWMIATPAIMAGVVAVMAAVSVRRYAAISELLILGLTAAVVHPLVSFALYFSLWHSPRHLIAMNVDRRVALPTIAATVATLLVAGLVWRFVEPTSSVAVQVVFIGLAALTGPHLVVTELFRYRSRSNTESP